MKRKRIVIAVAITAIVAAAFAGGALYATFRDGAGAKQAQEKEEGRAPGAAPDKDRPEGQEDHAEPGTVTMAAQVQKQNGIELATVAAHRIAGVVSATGKVEANADRIAHVSPRISGKVVAVRVSLGDNVAAGQTLATIDSVELGEALSRYHQSRTRLALAQGNMERIRTLVEKKIAARKEVSQAETEYRMAQTELHTDEERLSLYGVSVADLKGDGHKKPLLPVRSPMGGVVTEKHAIVGELADPSKNLYTVADLSSVWVMVDINEKDLAKVRRGQPASVTVGAFPDLKLKGRITYISDQVDQGTRTVKARVEVANTGRRLKPEMFATVELALGADAPAVPAVPEEAVQDLDGKKVVFISATEGKLVARPVHTGHAAGGLVEIVSGLKEGERYAAKGAFVLKSEVKKGELAE